MYKYRNELQHRHMKTNLSIMPKIPPVETRWGRCRDGGNIQALLSEFGIERNEGRGWRDSVQYSHFQINAVGYPSATIYIGILWKTFRPVIG